MTIEAALLIFARLLLAAVFAVAGLAKLADFRGSRQSLGEFGVPQALTGAFAVLLPLAELAFALAICFDPTALIGAAGVAALLAVFIAGITVSLLRGRTPDCHCFGQLSSSPVSWKTLLRNSALLTVAAAVIVLGPGSWPAFPPVSAIEIGLILAVIALALGLTLTVWVLFHMLTQNGRLLLRLEAIEKKLGIDPNAPEVPGIPVGQPAPSFELADLEGEKVSFAALLGRGKPVLLLFTEPTCGACEPLHPDVAQWQREHAGRLTVVPVSRGHLEANRLRSTEHGIRGVLMQADREVWTAYLATGTPSAVLVSNDGKIASPLAAGAGEIRKLVTRSTLPPPVKKGEPVPPLKLPDLDGETRDLSVLLRGHPTMVLFWSTTCGFCQQMLADIKDWELTRGADAPELLVISSGEVEENRKQGFRSPVLLDAVWGAGDVLGAGGTPSALLIDENGVVASEVGVGGPAVLALAGAREQERK